MEPAGRRGVIRCPPSATAARRVSMEAPALAVRVPSPLTYSRIPLSPSGRRDGVWSQATSPASPAPSASRVPLPVGERRWPASRASSTQRWRPSSVRGANRGAPARSPIRGAISVRASRLIGSPLRGGAPRTRGSGGRGGASPGSRTRGDRRPRGDRTWPRGRRRRRRGTSLPASRGRRRAPR